MFSSQSSDENARGAFTLHTSKFLLKRRRMQVHEVSMHAHACKATVTFARNTSVINLSANKEGQFQLDNQVHVKLRKA